MKQKKTKPAAGPSGNGTLPLRLEWRSPAELVENPRNWRRHPGEQLAALTDAIAEVGWAGACLYNEATGRLIDGHARRKVALDQGTDRIPVLVGSWTPEQEAKILATLDPLSSMAVADAAALDALLREVNTGSAALQEMLAGLAEEAGVVPPEVTPGAGGDDFDAGAALDGECRVQPGDLWLIDGGRHRLLCGDSTKAEDVARLMGGEEKAVLMNTDPPYGCSLDTRDRMKAAEMADGMRRPSLYRDDCDATVRTDGLDGKKLQDFLEGCIRAAVPYLADNAAFYLWHPMLTQGTFFAAAAAADILIHRQIIWVKPSLLFGFGDYHWQHELCFYGWRRGNRPEFYSERNQTTVWSLGHDTSSVNRTHPTQKPVELFARPIRNHAKRSEIVYEPFAGSGSQYVAAHWEGVRCFGLEISERHCEVVLARCEAEGLTVARAD